MSSMMSTQARESTKPDSLGTRIPSLDGLRAFAIAFVLLHHLLEYSRTIPPWGGLTDLLLRFARSTDLGYLGVLLFFVISGFIITTILQRERQQTGAISLAAFYRRRAFRIAPAMLVFLLAVVLMSWEGFLKLAYGDLLHVLAFAGNYGTVHSGDVNHFWSLAVEEQFYLLWPILFAFLPTRLSSRFALAAVLLAPLVRFGWLLSQHSTHSRLNLHFESVADTIAIGCLLALKRDEWRNVRWYRNLTTGPLANILPILIMFAALTRRWPTLYQLAGKTLIILGLALFLDAVISNPAIFLGRLLNWGPIVLLGRMSYSVYLWQQPFAAALHGTRPWAWFPMNIIAALLLAYASYRFVEQPALRLGKRWRASSNQPVDVGREQIGAL